LVIFTKIVVTCGKYFETVIIRCFNESSV